MKVLKEEMRSRGGGINGLSGPCLKKKRELEAWDYAEVMIC